MTNSERRKLHSEPPSPNPQFARRRTSQPYHKHAKPLYQRSDITFP
jgi:hypothetical protein